MSDPLTAPSLKNLVLWSGLHREAAAYYYIHAGHRRNAIELAIEVIEQAAAREIADAAGNAFDIEASNLMGAWAVESLLQGAYLREYHAWEKDTKQYINDQFAWNACKPTRWEKEPVDHVKKVLRALSTFSAVLPDVALNDIDNMRVKVNAAKHDAWSDDEFISKQEWSVALTAIESFWSALAEQEQFSI